VKEKAPRETPRLVEACFKWDFIGSFPRSFLLGEIQNHDDHSSHHTWSVQLLDQSAGQLLLSINWTMRHAEDVRRSLRCVGYSRQ
jgi:hypothetical protein